MGNGFPARSLFSYDTLGQHVSPFLLLDYAGPAEFKPASAPGERRGVGTHPHRGFETVTIVRKGLIDHSDSLGAAARFGGGDVQWLTAGKGVVHSEKFPLLDADAPNPLELFQIWLNLPARNKTVSPHFTMFWSEKIPRHVAADAQGRTTDAPVHGRDPARFARHPDGREERAEGYQPFTPENVAACACIAWARGQYGSKFRLKWPASRRCAASSP